MEWKLHHDDFHRTLSNQFRKKTIQELTKGREITGVVMCSLTLLLRVKITGY
jgi:hypothetical protein